MKKFEFKETPVTEHQLEVFIILMEEAAEIQQRASKLIRFGPGEIQPGQPFTNVERLSWEVGDLMYMMQLAFKANLLDDTFIEEGKKSKEKQLKKFMKTIDDY